MDREKSHAIFSEFKLLGLGEESDALPVQIQEPKDPTRVRRFIASDESVDRYGDVILQSGWDLGEFQKNPVVMQFHDYHAWPIGSATACGIVDNKLLVDAEFDPPDVDESADMVLRKIDHGTIRAGSVGFIGHAIADRMNENRATDEEKDLLTRFPAADRVFYRTELIEWTICPIGANRNALVAAMLKGVSFRTGTESIGMRPRIVDAVAKTHIPEAAWDGIERIERILNEG